MSLMRLAYASEATFAPQPVDKGVEPHVARILMTSRRNNSKAKLVGGLYYGDRHFFQYLEGEEAEVRQTFERIQGDDRHRNITILIEEPLSQRTFADWSMKYVPLSRDVRSLMERHGKSSFEPASFSAQQCEDMIELIRRSSHGQRLTEQDVRNGAGAERLGFSRGLRNGLIVAALGLLGALLVAGSML